MAPTPWGIDGWDRWSGNGEGVVVEPGGKTPVIRKPKESRWDGRGRRFCNAGAAKDRGFEFGVGRSRKARRSGLSPEVWKPASAWSQEHGGTRVPR
jgi:hypothetical protein